MPNIYAHSVFYAYLIHFFITQKLGATEKKRTSDLESESKINYNTRGKLFWW